MTQDEAINEGKMSIVEKIRKLLRLARDKGATEHEAAQAMTMAQRLMLQHNIENVTDAVEQLAVRGDWKDTDMDKYWQRTLASAVAVLYSCRCVTRGGKQVQFVGKPSNVLICADTLQWIVDQMQDLYKEGLKAFRLEQGGSIDKRLRADFRSSFKEACAKRIYWRCEEIVAKSRNDIPAHMALVVIDQALAAADDLLSDVKSSRSKGRRFSGFGTGAGDAAGRAVKLQHSVNPTPKAITHTK